MDQRSMFPNIMLLPEIGSHSLLICFMVFFVIGLNAEVPANLSLGIFDFATTESARTAWQAGRSSPEVGLFPGVPGVEKRGVSFPCRFIPGESRCFWDHDLNLDLTKEQKFSLRIYIEDPSLISYLTIYFHSSTGWYAMSFGDLLKGWQTIKCNRIDFHTEGDQLGWHVIDKIRISPWKATEGETNMIINEIRFYTSPISIIEETDNPDTYSVEQGIYLLTESLDAYSLEYNVISDTSIEGGALVNTSLAIFPYNRDMTPGQITAVEDFVTSGGKIILFYTLPGPLRDLLGLEIMGWLKISTQGMHFIPGIVECLPEYVGQASWNIMTAQPTSSETKVLGYWEDDSGEMTEYPAWLIGKNGAYMTHILLRHDFENKKRMILSLVNHFIPGQGIKAARAAVDGIGRVGEYQQFEEAVTGIRAESLGSSRSGIVEDHLTAATIFHDMARQSLNKGEFCPSLTLSEQSRSHLLEAYYYAQSPRIPEFRAVWNHSGAGAWEGDWGRSAENLSQNGFNAILPNMLWGGLAHYNSDLLPHSSTFEEYGDQIEACVKACHKKGIEVHVWKVNWNLGNAPQSFIDSMRSQGRMQVDKDGNPGDWLCPSHPDNYQLELDTMLEVAQSYDVDGIHFDYIRYPNSKFCYCENCRKRFEADTGVTVENWPDDCYSGPHKDLYREWRAEQITRLVRGVSEQIHQKKAGVKISAAVFRNYPSCKESVGQDWALWVEKEYLDFICPMNYTDSITKFQDYLEDQMAIVSGRIPLYPGVGVGSSHSTLQSGQTILQLKATRDFQTGGYVLFNYNQDLALNHLPNLRKGFTAPPQSYQIFLLR